MEINNKDYQQVLSNLFLVAVKNRGERSKADEVFCRFHFPARVSDVEMIYNVMDETLEFLDSDPEESTALWKFVKRPVFYLSALAKTVAAIEALICDNHQELQANKVFDDMIDLVNEFSAFGSAFCAAYSQKYDNLVKAIRKHNAEVFD